MPLWVIKKEMELNSKTVYIFTVNYPFGLDSEAFLQEELNVASEKGVRVVVIPARKAKGERPVPSGVVVDRSICDAPLNKKLLAVIRTIFSMGMLSVWACLFCDSAFSIKYLPDAIKYIYAANLVYGDVIKRAKNPNPSIFYGYWFTYYPIAFAYYRLKHPDSIHQFICRGHGSDIYSVRVGVYYPLKKFVLNHIDAVYTVSEYGKRYLLEKYPTGRTPVIVARLGVRLPSKIPFFESSDLVRVVSCSTVIESKRVDRLHRVLKAYAEKNGCNIEWHHFGDGNCFAQLSEQVAREKSNGLHCILHGFVPNDKLMEYYANHAVNVFISVSESEGVPVSMMEALSYNIPILSTNVGGCNELVTRETGYLISADFTQEEFDKGLSFVLSNRFSYSQTVHGYYLAHYDAVRNYTMFYSDIMSL